MDFFAQRGGSKACTKLKTSVSLNMEGRGLTGSSVQPLSPVEYQFLLRRPSAVTEELVEVSTDGELTSVNRAA